MNDSTIQGTVVSLYEIGCLMGALATMRFGDQFGRRKVIFVGAIVMTIGATLQCTSFSLAQLIVGRIVTGIGNGFITSTVSGTASCYLLLALG
ncbi:glucose-inactivated glycerol proton symporter STL1 [Sugiyamaella lignohabitans]|uniref:Glucose-inactivated glycerol proton symporter STL1 n=1 Tax=Sugiyamaella lignohabitans TaxID=796027 RepID=A0A167F1F7_9ASCO|nr:glucose-inactivated glycerol proton symporter STL1 [Sugiyamaella lignohabitans]ANB14702.1 glucose-inactivated glycerol proton symporter STL1 [Sugiyamaella lignohabitans]